MLVFATGLEIRGGAEGKDRGYGGKELQGSVWFLDKCWQAVVMTIN